MGIYVQINVLECTVPYVSTSNTNYIISRASMYVRTYIAIENSKGFQTGTERYQYGTIPEPYRLLRVRSYCIISVPSTYYFWLYWAGGYWGNFCTYFCDNSVIFFSKFTKDSKSMIFGTGIFFPSFAYFFSNAKIQKTYVRSDYLVLDIFSYVTV